MLAIDLPQAIGLYLGAINALYLPPLGSRVHWDTRFARSSRARLFSRLPEEGATCAYLEEHGEISNILYYPTFPSWSGQYLLDDSSNLRYHDFRSGIHIIPVVRPLFLRREGI